MNRIYNIGAHCFGTIYYSKKQSEIYDVSGQIVGTQSIVPSIYIEDKISQIRNRPSLSFRERLDRLETAGQIYKNETLAGLNPKNYISLVNKISGLQTDIISNSLNNISNALSNMQSILQAATPNRAILDWDEDQAKKGCSLFSRKGDVVTIIAAGNGPGVHSLWPQALGLGYRTIVKPSSHEPFTAQRIVCALEEAGLEEYIALMPTDHHGVETLITMSDLAVVYGGATIAKKYHNNSKILIQGPGRSKIIIGEDISHAEAIDTAIESVFSLGGAACVSASAILVEKDPESFMKLFKEAILNCSQNQLSPTFGIKQAKIYQEMLRNEDIECIDYHNSTESIIMQPHILLTNNAFDPRVQRELPFPCVTITPFDYKNDWSVVSKSLVVTLLSKKKHLIDKLLNDSSISNVYIGKIPTTWMDLHVPHDGYLADFLMCNRGLRMESKWLKSTDKVNTN